MSDRLEESMTTLTRRSKVFLTAVALATATTGILAVVYPFTTPVFGLDSLPDGSLFAADAGSGIFKIQNSQFTQVAHLPGVTDVAPIDQDDMFATTSPGFGGEGKLYRITGGMVHEVADILGFETTVNPDGGIIESNPFDVEVLPGTGALVADAAGNSVLVVNRRGDIDWVATLPDELVSTANAKKIFGCPESGAPPCGLPDQIPAQAVATSVAIGPDGAYYVGELKGFPAPTGESRLWRIEPGTLHAACGTSPACQVVADGFTSIIDLTFDRDGMLHVVELDEASWLAMEFGQGIGGSVNRCHSGTWTCQQIATGLPMLTSATVTRQGTIYVVTKALIPGAADISPLP
jgi:hypothetical protein